MKYIIVVDETQELHAFADLLNAKYCSRAARILSGEAEKALAGIESSDAIYLVWQADVEGFGSSKATEFIMRSSALLKRTPRVFLTACHVYNARPQPRTSQLGPAAVADLLQEISPITTVMVTPGSLIFNPGAELHVVLSEKYLAKRGLDHKTMWVRAGTL